VHGARLAAWVRHAMRQVTAEAFPAGWRLGESAPRSHASGDVHRTCGLHLDAVTSPTPETWTQTFDRPAAEVIRQFITQA
jgi:hypothetical protein